MQKYNSRYFKQELLTFYIGQLVEQLSREQVLGIILDRRRIKGQTHVITRADDESKVIGAVTFSPVSQGTSIDYLAVHHDYRGQGIGRKLLDHVETHSADRILTTARSCSFGNTNQNPAEWYIQNGFTKRDEPHQSLVIPRGYILLEKILTHSYERPSQG
ncbi:MAG: GNAT family N-acetyltransferase [Candidatus Woesearchaeota archaeon]